MVKAIHFSQPFFRNCTTYVLGTKILGISGETKGSQYSDNVYAQKISGSSSYLYRGRLLDLSVWMYFLSGVQWFKGETSRS